jgi:hypothetical protein
MDGDHHDAPTPLRPGPLARLLAVVVAIAVAAVLMFAGAAKVDAGAKELRAYQAAHALYDRGARASDPAGDYRWLAPPAGGRGGFPMNWAYALGEFAAVVGVLLFCRTRLPWPFVAMLFAGLFGYAMNRVFNDLPCGCFGVLYQPPKWFSPVMDVAFVALSLLVLRTMRVGRRGLVAILVVSLVCAGAGWWYAGTTAPAEDQRAPQTEPDAQPPAQEIPDPVADLPVPGGANAGGAVDPEASPADQVIQLGVLPDVSAATADDPAYYVFVWDPTCDTCAKLKPVVDYEGEELEASQDPTLRVRTLEKKVLAREHGVPDYAWPESPTVFIVRAGEVISAFGGEETLFPADVAEALYNDGDLPSVVGFWD